MFNYWRRSQEPLIIKMMCITALLFKTLRCIVTFNLKILTLVLDALYVKQCINVNSSYPPTPFRLLCAYREYAPPSGSIKSANECYQTVALYFIACACWFYVRIIESILVFQANEKTINDRHYFGTSHILNTCMLVLTIWHWRQKPNIIICIMFV